MTRSILLVLAVSAYVTRGEAQVDWLTVAESEEIIEELPQFKSSIARGECPSSDVLGGSTSRHSSFQLRGFCPPEGFAGSMLIGNFTVDRLTGAVTYWNSAKPISEPPEMNALARKLVAKASARMLSQREAECVARQAGKAEWGPSEPMSVARADQGTGHSIRFVIRHPLVKLGATAESNVTVDTSALAVLEAANGPEIHSSQVDELLSRMRAVRAAPSLSIAEAIEVAIRVPSIVAQGSTKCSLLAAGFGTATKRFVTVEDTCKDYPRSVLVIGAVDVRTGAVTEPRTQRVLDTPESIALARELLRRAGERQAATITEIDDTCR